MKRWRARSGLGRMRLDRRSPRMEGGASWATCGTALRRRPADRKCICRCGRPGIMRLDLVVRTALPAKGLAAAVRAALLPIDPNLPASEFRTLQELVDKAVSPRRFQ